MKVETTVEISKPPSEVYEFLMDEENLSLWIKNFIKMERLKGLDGEVGSISRHIYNENGRTIEFIEEIVAIEIGKYFKARLRSKNMEIDIVNHLSPIEGHSTRLMVTSILHPQSLKSKIMTLFSKKSLIKRQEEDLNRLKIAVEELTEDFE